MTDSNERRTNYAIYLLTGIMLVGAILALTFAAGLLIAAKLAGVG